MNKEQEQIVAEAIRILEQRLAYQVSDRAFFGSPSETRRYLRLKLADREQEVFAVLALDNQHKLLDYAELFSGTINAASVYPREVIKWLLDKNAAAYIIAHNHPSGDGSPSRSDVNITSRIKEAGNLFDMRLLDHMVITGHDVTSMAERGLI